MAVEKGRTAVKDYQVAARRNVVLDVVINRGQAGAVTVELDDQSLGTVVGLRSVNIGKGSDVAGKTLSIVAVIGRTNAVSARLGLRVRLRGGAFTRTWEIYDEADLGEQAEFAFRIELVD